MAESNKEIGKKFMLPVSDWEQIGLDNAKFILNEGQSYVKYLSEVSVKITNRAFSILSILIPITATLIAFIVKQGLSDFVTVFTFVIVAILILLMFILGKLVVPREYMPVGRAPIEICNEEFLGVTLSKELSMIALITNEIENCQSKIYYNEDQNEKRNNILKICMKLIGLLFVLSTTVVALYLIY